MMRKLWAGLVGAVVAVACMVSAPVASAQLSQATAQRIANNAVAADCGTGAFYVCGRWVQPLISRSGSQYWVWDGDVIYQCRIVCVGGYNRICRHQGKIDGGGAFLLRRTSC